LDRLLTGWAGGEILAATDVFVVVVVVVVDLE